MTFSTSKSHRRRAVTLCLATALAAFAAVPASATLPPIDEATKTSTEERAPAAATSAPVEMPDRPAIEPLEPRGGSGSPPTADDDGPYVLDEDGFSAASPASGVLVGDTDPESDPLVAVLVTDVSNGTLTLNADGSFSYTPDPNYHGNDSFTYVAHDGTSTSNVATVSFIVTSINDAPVSIAQGVSTDEDTAKVITMSASDADGDAHTFHVLPADVPTNGTLGAISASTCTGGAPNSCTATVTYTPNLNYNGPDSFTFYSSDGIASSNFALVSITVNSVNDAPVANNEGPYVVSEDSSISASPASGALANDTDADGDPLFAVLVGNVANGTLTLNADGSFTYTPNANYSGNDAFTYVAHDGTTTSNVATLSIIVTAINDPPSTTSDAKTTAEDTLLSFPRSDLTANDSPGAGEAATQTMTVTAVTSTASTHGTVALAGSNVNYSPDFGYYGPASFQYTACDNGAPVLCATGTVNVTVTPVLPTLIDPAEASVHDGLVDVRGTGKPLTTVEVVQAGVVVASTTVRASGEWFAQLGLPTGTHTIAVRRNGSSGPTPLSAPRTFRVDAGRPVVDITTATGAVYAPGSPTAIAGTASDPNGGVVRIELHYYDARNVRVATGDATCAACGTTAAGPLQWTHSPTLLPGLYRVEAFAVDAVGNLSIPDAINILRL